MTEQMVQEIIGDPKRVDADLQEFRKNVSLLSSRRAHLIKKYPKRWVAIFGHEVKADATSLGQLLMKVDQMQLPRSDIVVRYIDRNQRRMIL